MHQIHKQQMSEAINKTFVKFQNVGTEKRVVNANGEAFSGLRANEDCNSTDCKRQQLNRASNSQSSSHARQHSNDQKQQELQQQAKTAAHSKAKTKDRHANIVQQTQETRQTNQPSQLLHPDFCKIRLLYNIKKVHKGQYYCGKCRIEIYTPRSFINHCITVCHSLNNIRSSHHLISFDYNQKIRQFQSKLLKKKKFEHYHKFKSFWTKMLGTTEDHSELPFECKICLKIFRKARLYHSHMILMHQGIIDSTSSHIVLRFQMEDGRPRRLYFTDRKVMINDEKTAFCPCEPGLKMSVTKFIKHVREVHKGISPIYQLKCVALNQEASILNMAKNKDKISQIIAEIEESVVTLYKSEAEQERISSHSNSSQTNKLESSRLNQSQTDYEVDQYNESQEEKAKVQTDSNLQLTMFMESVFGTANDHSDMPFECQTCRMMFLSGQEYFEHLNTLHQGRSVPNSSHVTLRLHLQSIVNVFLSDSVTYLNEKHEKIAFCPCKPRKKMTVSELIRHVRESHWGISPIYDVK